MKKICASDNASEKVNAVKEAYDKLISTLDRIGDNWIDNLPKLIMKVSIHVLVHKDTSTYSFLKCEVF